jgi:hypothetical protein
MSGSALRETVGFLAVVAGLVFVGLELRQNTAIARAATRQALTEQSLESIMALATDDELGGQLDQWLWGDDRHTDACADGLHQACRWVRGQVRILENAFLQFQEGLIDESVFLSYGWRNNPLVLSPHFAPWWQAIRSSYHPDFLDAFEAEYDLVP